jgi:hypothetical protein
MNYRHAFNDFKVDNKKADNVGRYIFESFSSKVSNVMINSLALLPGSTDKEAVTTPINNGKWDAAFEVVGNPSLGFDFRGSPFGPDYFDFYPFPTRNDLKFQDVFTGFIFYKPLKEHKFGVGIPKLCDEGYDRIVLNRIAISGKAVEKDREQEFIRDLGQFREHTYGNLSDITQKINLWLSNSNSN